MNDAEYIFNKDCRDKKRTARGSKHKINGSKSKKCTLPGDYLTPAQKKKFSKTIADVNLSAPMTYAQFKSLRGEIQREYLLFLRDTFKVNAARVSEDMFCLHKTSLTHYIATTHPENSDIFARKGAKMSADNLTRWHDFLAGSGEDTESSVEEPEDSGVIVEKTDKFHIYKLDDGSSDGSDIPEKVSDKRVMAGSFELYFGEGVSASDLYEILKKHLDDEGVVCGQIKVDFYRRDV